MLTRLWTLRKTLSSIRPCISVSLSSRPRSVLCGTLCLYKPVLCAHTTVTAALRMGTIRSRTNTRLFLFLNTSWQLSHSSTMTSNIPSSALCVSFKLEAIKIFWSQHTNRDKRLNFAGVSAAEKPVVSRVHIESFSIYFIIIHSYIGQSDCEMCSLNLWHISLSV